jgi:regulator of RNase E activity RraA
MSNRSLIKQLAEYDTALIANTIGYLDPTPDHEFYMGGSIASVTPALGPTVGVAVTCEVDTSTPGGSAHMDLYFQMLKEMKTMNVPVVLVAKTVGSRPDHECVLGDGMAKMLFGVGCVGCVTDGGVRDVEGMLTVPFAAYCRGRTIHHCAIRFKTINQPIEIGGITVNNPTAIRNCAYAGGTTVSFPAGQIDLNGDEALKFVRVRKCDDDFHRAARQQAFVNGVKGKLASLSGVPFAPWQGAAAIRSIGTDMGVTDLMKLGWLQWRLTSNSSDRIVLAGIPRYVNGISYVVGEPNADEQQIAQFVRR